MDSFNEPSIIIDDSDELSSFEIEESILGDDNSLNATSKSSNDKTPSKPSVRRSSAKPNRNVSVNDYRSFVNDSSDSSSDDSSSSESEASDEFVPSDDEGNSDSSGHEDTTASVKDEKPSDRSKDEEDAGVVAVQKEETKMKCTEVNQAEYDGHVKKIAATSERIGQYENLLKLSAQLPDKGEKLKQLVAKLKSDLAEMQSTLKVLKVRERRELSLDFRRLTINDSKNETESGHELSYEQDDSIASLLQQIKLSQKTMPGLRDFADQPRLINGELMSHQRHALAWMIWRENQFPKGGILGDDMGLGKTLTMISLIARHIELSEGRKERDGTEANGGTLVVCPASLIRQWEEEIHKFTNHALNVCLHHGDRRAANAHELTMYDIVITTYGIVRTDVEKNGALAQMHWERIVLDEAHTIRNYTSKQSLTCCRLKAARRWALTGTPIQNKHGDVFALIKFLQCSPLTDSDLWKRWTSSKAEQRIRYLLKFLLLRRTKDELGKIGEIDSLPEKTLKVVPVQLTADELMVYETVASFSKVLSEKFRHQRDPNYQAHAARNAQARESMQKALDFFAISGSVSTSHILLVILRLRQICIHPNLIDAMLMEEDLRDMSAQMNILDELNEMTIGEGDDDAKLHRSNPVFNADRPSSKFNLILETIQTEVIKRKQKAVVVSQFTGVLRLFEKHLSSKGVKYLVLIGSTKISHRQNIVQSFNEDPDEQILLLSLTAGGVGLNLCGANHLFFVDPHWNPQLESQAEDRVYRIGQTKPVTIYRFICEGTIEERIEKLQDRKRGVAKNILSGYKLNIDDMMSLI